MGVLMDAWQSYQQYVRETVRVVCEERRLLLLWLGMVEATHRDPFTMAHLERVIRLGNWCGADIETARRLAEYAGADALTDD